MSILRKELLTEKVTGYTRTASGIYMPDGAKTSGILTVP